MPGRAHLKSPFPVKGTDKRSINEGIVNHEPKKYSRNF